MLFIDAQNAGISGDMFIAALLDMGTSVKRIEEALTPISGAIGEFKIRTKKVKRGPFEATSYGFDFEKLKITYSEAKAAIKNAGLSEGARDFAISCFETLTDAESKVHGVKKEELHLHDVADTIGDFVAAAACLNELGLLGTKVLSSPVNTGKGFFTFHNKRSTLPAPATAEILKGKPIFGDVDFELTTPTGAAILVNLAEGFVDEFPQMRIEKIGYGAGKNDPDFSNVLKLYVGEEADFGLIRESLDLLETNVDTASGEVLGYLFEELLEKGALDVVVVPCTMKKNRPGHIVKVLCKSEDSARLSRIVMKETGSLGVRIMPSVHRYVLKRTIVKKKVRIDKKDFTVRFKVASDAKEDVISERPEFEDVKKIATETGLSLREVERLLRG
ncbi:MAG: nickel pincer cofactor biosynthesis protein LarC [Candidatus Hydrothermarchaeales archaeon]